MERLSSTGRPPKLFGPVVSPTTDTPYLSSDSDEEDCLSFHDAPSLPLVGSLNRKCGSNPAPQLPNRFAKLLNYVRDSQTRDTDKSTTQTHQIDALVNAPIFTAEAYDVVEGVLAETASLTDPTPQYGLIGIHKADEESSNTPSNSLVLANLNLPWSAFICGSQGAGKSHTLSCLLESALVANNGAGELPNPLTGLVMHYDSFSSYETTQYCEAAYLCSSGIPVTVLVCPSNIWAMTRLYGNLPGLKPGDPRPKVLPLYLSEDQLNISRILKLMAVDTTSASTPMYMEVVMSIIREMAMEGPSFSYSAFRQRLTKVAWAPSQRVPLDLRLQMLDSFLAPSERTHSPRPAPAREPLWSFEPGTMAIIDLSDPMVSSDDACSLFSICLSIFIETRAKCGRIVVLDEAHKFLSKSGEAHILTNELTSIIRQQRHTGTRVLIATQEPTLSSELLDLANATFVHRFLSPAWYETLRKHLAGVEQHAKENVNSLFHDIVALKTGEAILFCPTARICVNSHLLDHQETCALGSGYMKVKIRKRITADGGQSIMATDSTATTTDRMIEDLTVDEIPMHIAAVAQPKATPKINREGNENGTVNGQLPQVAQGGFPPRKPTVLAALERMVQRKFQNAPYEWDSWAAVSHKRKKLLWTELEAKIGVPLGSIQNNSCYVSTLSDSMDRYLATLRQ